MTAADAERAREALQVATVRALAASIRASTAHSAGPASMHVEHAPEPLAALLAAGSISLSDLTVAYLGLGGSCTAFDIDGYVHGVLLLPTIEAHLLDQAAAELIW